MNMDQVDQLIKKLIRYFIIMILPAVMLFAFSYFTHQRNIEITAPGSIQAWGVLLLILTVSLSVALPILMRTIFHDRSARRGEVDFRGYERFQIRQMAVAVSGTVFAALAYLFLVPKFHLYTTVLAGLYGIYSVLPSRKKISGEMKYYKIKE